MLIDCPACAKSYHVNPADIEGGRTVVCSRCDARWFVDSLAAKPGVVALPGPEAVRHPVDPAPPAGATMPTGERRPALRVPRRVTFAMASLALVALTVGARARIVQLVPRSAAVYAAAGLPINPHGLDFRGVEAARLDPSSPMVTVSGEIRNVAGRRVRVPRLVFEIRDAAGQSLVRWSERAPSRLLAGGHALAFASAPHQIPGDSRSVLVRFDNDQG